MSARVSVWPGNVAMVSLPLAICVWRFVPILWRMTDAGAGDFPTHIQFAQAIAETGQIDSPHYGYQLAVIAAHALRPAAGWQSAALIASLGGMLLTTLILTWWIARVVPESKPGVRIAAALVLPLALLTVQPMLPWGHLPRDPWLVGYFPANQYHNPTTLLSKPFMLALFALGVPAVFGVKRSTAAVAGCAALVLLSGLVKPSFLMAFLPAVFGIALFNRNRADWRLLILGVAIPTAGLLAAQFALRYLGQAEDGTRIVFAPLAVLRLYGTTDLLTLAVRLTLSILFPLVVTALFYRQVPHDPAVVLAWLVLAVAISFAYLLSEEGGDASAGNFFWSGQLAAFLLFVVTAMFLLRQLVTAWAGPERSTVLVRAAICALAFSWHVVSGVKHLQTSWFS